MIYKIGLRPFLFVYLYLHFYCISFPLLFSPLIPLPHTITTLLSMSMSPFSFLLEPSTLNPSLHQLPSCSLSLFLFCLLVLFVFQILHMNEITWYFSFFDFAQCSPSPSILLKRVELSSFLRSSNSPLCKCPIVVLSTHLLMDTWAAPISW